MEKKIQVGETKGFLFFIGNFFGKKKLVTSLLIERQEKSQNLGSIPASLQKLCRKNQAPGTKYPPPGLIGLRKYFLVSKIFLDHGRENFT